MTNTKAKLIYFSAASKSRNVT